MQHVPDYIVEILQDKTKGEGMTKGQYLLTVEPQQPEDRDYLQTLSVAKIRHEGDPHDIITQCDKFIPHLTVPECRFFMQDIRIWQYEKLEQYEKAIALIEEKIEELDVRILDREYKAIVENYKKLDDTPNVIKYLELCLNLPNGDCDTDLHEELAELYETVKDYKNSAKCWGMAAAWEARFSADYWQNVGRALALDGQSEEAMMYFRFALKINPKDAYTHYYMGLHYQMKKDKYRSLHHYTQALKLKPDFIEVQLNMGKMEFNDDGDIRAAIECFEKAIEHDAEGRFLFYIYANLRKFYDEIKEFEKAAYYRGKYFEMAGFPADMGEYLDSKYGDDLPYPGDEEDEE